LGFGQGEWRTDLQIERLARQVDDATALHRHHRTDEIERVGRRDAVVDGEARAQGIERCPRIRSLAPAGQDIGGNTLDHRFDTDAAYGAVDESEFARAL